MTTLSVTEPHMWLDINGSSHTECTDAPLEELLLGNCSHLLPAEWRDLKVLTRGQVWTPAVLQRIAMLAVVITFTLVGNLVILVVLTCSKYRRRHSRVNVFLINLAVGDLSVCTFTMTTEVLFVVFDGAWVMGAVACKVLLYIQVITLASTTFILTAMSFDRYMAICRPLSFGNTTARARKMIAVSWLLAFICASPQLLIFKQKATGIYLDGEILYKCLSKGYTRWWQRKTYFTFMTTYILVIPAILISFCYINVMKVVWQQGQEAKQTNGVALRKSVADNKSVPRAKIKTVKMTLCIICTFIMCWTPYFVVHLIHIWSEYKYEIPESVYAFAETTALWNSALNPILYGCFNIRMKGNWSDICCACVKSCRINKRTEPNCLAEKNRAARHIPAKRQTNSPAKEPAYSKIDGSGPKREPSKDETCNGFRLRVRFTGSEGKSTQTKNLLDHEKSDDDLEETTC